jgi:hypothetical protein
VGDRNLIEIDGDRLDEEWMSQPTLYYDFAVRLAESKAALVEAKANVDVVRAEISLKIRNDPAKYAVAKLTEKSLEERVEMHARVREAEAAHNQARLDTDILQAAVTALDHRKKALESLVYLHGANYHSEPKARTPEAKEAVEKIARAKVRKPMPDPRS